MKENKYDNEQFFVKYSQMECSKKGLSGAGEWSELQKILPDFQSKNVLDLGCGYGWHCKYAVENGAAFVLGTDISYKMLEAAKQKNNDQRIQYQCIAMEDLEFKSESFDIILSSLAFHYVKDFKTLVKNIALWLKKDGELVFLQSILFLLQTKHRIGIMMKMEVSFIFQSISITMKEKEKLFS